MVCHRPEHDEGIYTSDLHSLDLDGRLRTGFNNDTHGYSGKQIGILI